MSLYYVNKVIKLLTHDENPAARRQWFEDPDVLLDRMELTPDERRALKQSDLAALYAMGAHPALLSPYMGLTDKGDPRTLMGRYLAIVKDLGHPSIAT